MQPPTRTYEQLLFELDQAQRERERLASELVDAHGEAEALRSKLAQRESCEDAAFQAVFRVSPDIMLLLTPDFRVVEADEWLELFPDPVFANSVLDRLAHNAHQLVLEGESYRRTKRPEA